jgi:hypothetical protein
MRPAGFHALNANPNMAILQTYTIDLLREVEAEVAPEAATVGSASSPSPYDRAGKAMRA